MLIGPGNWRWIPRIGSFVSVPLSLVAWIVLPPPGMKERRTETQRWKRVDFVGALSFTSKSNRFVIQPQQSLISFHVSSSAGIVLFTFSITSGVAHVSSFDLVIFSTRLTSFSFSFQQGWKNAIFIVTLLVSILLFVAFLIWELRLPPTHVRSLSSVSF